MNPYSAVFLSLIAVAVIIQLWLIRRQQRSIRHYRDQVPAAFARRMALADHRKGADYSLARLRLDTVDLLTGTVLLLAWTVGGGIDLFDRTLRQHVSDPLPLGLAVIAAVMAITALAGVPSRLYQTFVIEQRFGFNHTSLRLFLGDLLLGTGLSALLLLPLLALILWLMPAAPLQPHGPSLWWLWIWLAWNGYMLLMQWLYPALIAPLFNRFTPLTDAALHRRIEALLARCGFASRGIYVMDGSRRSGHGNAYFTGLGRHKRIVFYDTLLDSLSDEETEAVLAHELGHFRHHHIHWRIAMMAIISFLALAVMAWLLGQPAFYSGLGVTRPSAHCGLLLFMLALPAVSFYFEPLAMGVTRRQEFQADGFAARVSDAHHLIAALIKLYRDNAATLTPDPLYSAVHDSHPPAPVRIARLSARMERSSG